MSAYLPTASQLSAVWTRVLAELQKTRAELEIEERQQAQDALDRTFKLLADPQLKWLHQRHADLFATRSTDTSHTNSMES